MVLHLQHAGFTACAGTALRVWIWIKRWLVLCRTSQWLREVQGDSPAFAQTIQLSTVVWAQLAISQAKVCLNVNTFFLSCVPQAGAIERSWNRISEWWAVPCQVKPRTGEQQVKRNSPHGDRKPVVLLQKPQVWLKPGGGSESRLSQTGAPLPPPLGRPTASETLRGEKSPRGVGACVCNHPAPIPCSSLALTIRQDPGERWPQGVTRTPRVNHSTALPGLLRTRRSSWGRVGGWRGGRGGGMALIVTLRNNKI